MKLESISPLTTNSSSSVFVFRGKTEDNIIELLLNQAYLAYKEGYSTCSEDIIEIKTPLELAVRLECAVDLEDFKYYGLDESLKTLLDDSGYADLSGFSEEQIVDLLKLDTLTYPITVLYMDRWKTALCEKLQETADYVTCD